MAQNKTIQNEQEVGVFLNKIENEQKSNDAFEILEIMEYITGEKPKMWGASIVGFGKYHYKYKSGREGDMFLTGFSPRKQNITLYIMTGLQEYDEILKKMGKYKLGKSCFYIKKLDDIDKTQLIKMIADSVERIKKKYY